VSFGGLSTAPTGLMSDEHFTVDGTLIDRVPHRAAVTASPGGRLDALSGRGLRHASHASPDRWRGGVLRHGRLLICDRDPKWSGTVRAFREREGVRIVRIPVRAPNCNAYAERFVRSIKEECLHRVILLGDRHLRRTMAEFVAHYDAERNHQGLSNELIQPRRRSDAKGVVRRRQCMGGMPNYYFRAA